MTKRLLCATIAVALALTAPAATADEVVGRGIAFLRAHQDDNGAWRGDPAFTGLTVMALLANGVGETDPACAGALRYLLAARQEDGGIYLKERGLANYSTSVAVTALAATNNPAYGKVIRAARDFLVKGQLIEF